MFGIDIDTAPESVLRGALRDAEKEIDRIAADSALIRDALFKVVDQRDAALSVIEQAKAALDYGSGERHFLERIYTTQNALAQSHTSVLAKVKADAWEECMQSAIDVRVQGAGYASVVRDPLPGNPYREADRD